MKNDINIIKNELIEQTNEKKQRELERKQKKHYNDFKKLCSDMMHVDIYQSVEKGATLSYIYLQRNKFIEETLKDIKKQYIEVEDTSTWNDTTKYIREYAYPDYTIRSILSDAFEVEFKKFEKIQKKKDAINKELLKIKLYNYITDAINILKNKTDIYVIINNLQKEEAMHLIISDIEATDKEKETLRDIYPLVISKIKKERNSDYNEAKKERSKIKLPLWLKIVAFNKGADALGRLFKK